MNINKWIQKGLSACLIFATFATYSMVALANENNSVVLGELRVNGTNEVPYIQVNGEQVQSGRTIYSNSTLTTNENGATVVLGKLGKVDIAPNTTVTLKFDESGVKTDLSKGSARFYAAAGKNFDVTTKKGVVIADKNQNNTFEVVADDEGTSVLPESGTVSLNEKNVNVGEKGVVGKQTNTNKTWSGSWWLWTGVFAGAVAAILIAALNDNNEINLSGGTTVVSPTR
jgi:hypothetical protein